MKIHENVNRIKRLRSLRKDIYEIIDGIDTGVDLAEDDINDYPEACEEQTKVTMESAIASLQELAGKYVEEDVQLPSVFGMVGGSHGE